MGNGLDPSWLASPAMSSGLVTPLTNDSTGVALTTTPTEAGPFGVSVLTSIYVGAAEAYAGYSPTGNGTVENQSTWYHVDMMFPSASYAPTTGQWNWLVEWHDDPHTAPDGPYSIALGIYTALPGVTGQVGVDPQLVLRLAGGSSADPTYENVTMPGTVQYDHWYDMDLQIVWNTDPQAGQVEWIVDGRQIASQTFPTLFTNPDGTQSFNTFGLYNYHLNCPWQSTVDFDKVAIGPTQASVGG